MRRAPAFSTNGSVLFAAGAHPAARRLCRGLAATLLALPPLETTRPEVAQTAPRHSARLTTTSDDRQVPRRWRTPNPNDITASPSSVIRPGLPGSWKDIPAPGASTTESTGTNLTVGTPHHFFIRGVALSADTCEEVARHLDASQTRTPRGSGPLQGVILLRVQVK